MGWGLRGFLEHAKAKDVGHEGEPTQVSSNPPQTIQLEKQRDPNRKDLCAGGHTNSRGNGQ